MISSASFLGITGAVALMGFNGFYLAFGIPTAYLLTLLLIAEPLRNLGRFTLADAVAARFEGRGLRAAIAISTIVMTTVYLLIQFVGAGLIGQLLLGVNYRVILVLLAALMTIYLVLGGMVATTYIQVFKTALLVLMIVGLYGIVISRTGWNPVGPMTEAADRFGSAVVEPARPDLAISLNNLSVCVALGFGIMGLPHVMLRFLTVRDAKAARDSTQIAMWIFSAFFLLLPIFGYAALNEVGKKQIIADNPAGNVAGPRLAEVVGGDVVFAIVAGVIIATILAVLAGLAIAASGAVWHDLYTNVMKREQVDERRQLVVGRVAGVGIAIVATVLAAGAEKLNVAFLGNVAFSIAGSTTMPVLLLTFYWPAFNRTGAVAGIVGGLTASLLMVVLGPDVLKEDHVQPLSVPGIVSIPFAFACAYAGTLLGRGNPDAAGTQYSEFARQAFSREREPAAV
jgi:cation/acetate symporter